MCARVQQVRGSSPPFANSSNAQQRDQAGHIGRRTAAFKAANAPVLFRKARSEPLIYARRRSRQQHDSIPATGQGDTRQRERPTVQPRARRSTALMVLLIDLPLLIERRAGVLQHVKLRARRPPPAAVLGTDYHGLATLVGRFQGEPLHGAIAICWRATRRLQERTTGMSPESDRSTQRRGAWSGTSTGGS